MLSVGDLPKPKYELLREFTAILFKHDPMNVGPTEDEYEAEALSVLARFCEGALQLADSEDAILQYAAEAVFQTFKFWFATAPEPAALMPVTLELVKAYIDSFPPDPTQVRELVSEEA